MNGTDERADVSAGETDGQRKSLSSLPSPQPFPLERAELSAQKSADRFGPQGGKKKREQRREPQPKRVMNIDVKMFAVKGERHENTS